MNQNIEDKGFFSEIQPKFSPKTFIIFFLVIIGLIILFPKLIGLEKAVRLLTQANVFFLILALAAEIASYIGAAWLLGIILSRLGHHLSFKDRFKIGSIAAFTIHFLPIGSFGEGAVDYYFLRRRKVESGSILLMLVLRPIFTYIAFLIIFLLGLILVPTHPALHFSPKIVSFLLFLIILIGIFYLIYLYRHKDKFWRFFQGLFRFANRHLRRFRQAPIDDGKIQEIFEDIYQGIGLFGDKKRNSVFAVLAGLLYWIGDIACFFFVFWSFGYIVYPGVLIFGYGVATLLALVSMIPGGVGVTEGSMALIYSGLGVPSGIALMSILVFRLISFWIWIPISLVSYVTLQRASKSQDK